MLAHRNPETRSLRCSTDGAWGAVMERLNISSAQQVKVADTTLKAVLLYLVE